MEPDLNTVIKETLKQHEQITKNLSNQVSTTDFQFPWNIASAGAKHLKNNTSAISSLVSGGSKVVTSSNGPSIVAGISSKPTNPTNTNKVLNDGLFSGAIDAVKADELLRTVFIGFATDAQIGPIGGGGGTGVAYDIVTQSNYSAVEYSTFKIGIGGKVSTGLIVGAMSVEPSNLNFSTCVWDFGATIAAVGVLVQVIMRSSDLSLIGFGLNLGGGLGISSSTGYGSISILNK